MTELTVDELAELIRNSVGTSGLSCEFGPKGSRLKRDKNGQIESAWAVPILQQLRGVTFEAGAGI